MAHDLPALKFKPMAWSFGRPNKIRLRSIKGLIKYKISFTKQLIKGKRTSEQKFQHRNFSTKISAQNLKIFINIDTSHKFRHTIYYNLLSIQYRIILVQIRLSRNVMQLLLNWLGLYCSGGTWRKQKFRMQWHW